MMIYAATNAGFGWPGRELVGQIPLIWLRVTCFSQSSSLAELVLTTRQILFSSQMLWASSLALIRIGLLMFYRRIFAAMRGFRIANNVMIGVNIAWCITYCFVSQTSICTLQVLLILRIGNGVWDVPFIGTITCYQLSRLAHRQWCLRHDFGSFDALYAVVCH